MELENVAFIGRTYEKYMDMFAMDEKIFLDGPVLDCPAGPSSFTAQACAKEHQVTACGVLYNLPLRELAAKGRQDLALIAKKWRKRPISSSGTITGTKRDTLCGRISWRSRNP